jgi:uncharacterized protein YndB with AHSA1/START domain
VIDILEHINAIRRDVSRTGEEVSVLLKRSYSASVEDVWDALTDPERMRRWFMPITGELKIGGSFQLEGNAGGEILECEPPSRFKVTFGGPTSLVEVRLTAGAEDETTELELEHTVPAELAGSGAGALYVGPGWDGALLALAMYLAGETIEDPVAAANSPEVLRFSERSVRRWIAVVRESGTATEDELSAATEVSLAQFAPGIPSSEN